MVPAARYSDVHEARMHGHLPCNAKIVPHAAPVGKVITGAHHHHRRSWSPARIIIIGAVVPCTLPACSCAHGLFDHGWTLLGMLPKALPGSCGWRSIMHHYRQQLDERLGRLQVALGSTFC